MDAMARLRWTTSTGAIAVVLGLVVATLGLLAGPAAAEGAGSPAACTGMTENAAGGTATAPEGQIITAICFKAGQIHSDVVSTDGNQTGTYDKNRTQTDVLYSYTVSGLGTGSVTVTKNDGPGLSHVDYTLHTPDPSASLSGECDQATVTVDADGDSSFSVEVFITGRDSETITASRSYTLVEGETLTTSETAEESFTFEDCSSGGDPAPTVALSTACDETQPTVSVAIDNDGDQTFEVEVSINGVSQGTISETTTFQGDAFDVLTATYGDDSKEATFRSDCAPGEFLESTATYEVGSECQVGLPALTYDAKVSETADDPIDEITLMVVDAGGVELAETTFSESEAGVLPLPTDLEGETVNVSWDFDDTTTQQTLAGNCTQVQGIVHERDDEPAVGDEAEGDEPAVDEEPAALPATEVKGKQVASDGELPNTGAEHVMILLLLGSALLSLGGSFLLLSDRRRGVLA